MDELNSLVGLRVVKDKVNDLIVYQKIQKMRRENDLYSVKSTLHLVFLGNPGTGKQRWLVLLEEYTSRLVYYQRDISWRFLELI